MDNEDATNAGDGEFAPAQQLGAPSAEGPDDTFEVEHEGQVYQLPGVLKGGFLRQADYTRKTQELAAHRRAVEAAGQAVAAQAQAAGQASQDQVQLAALDHQLQSFHGVDWQAFSAQDPQGAQALWGRFQGMAQARDQLAYALNHHEERRALQAARDTAAQMAETGRTLQREIEGWSPEVANKLVEYAQAFGVTLDELAQMADPRLWKVLHKAYQADQASQQAGAATTAARAQAIRPAVLVSGTAAGPGGMRDELATKEWMSRRNDQLRKGR